jgi:hypothetical protein
MKREVSSNCTNNNKCRLLGTTPVPKDAAPCGMCLCVCVCVCVCLYLALLFV